MKKNKGITLIELVIIICIFGILATVVIPKLGMITIMPHYSDGSRTGVVVKLSHRGIVFKTWEGQMNIGSMSTDGQGVAVPTVFEFSVKDENVVNQIESAAQSGKRVTLFYEQALMRSWEDGDTQYLITKVRD